MFIYICTLLEKLSVTHLGDPVRPQHLAIHEEQLAEASRDFGLLLRVFVTVEVGVGHVHLAADVTALELQVYCVSVIHQSSIG